MEMPTNIKIGYHNYTVEFPRNDSQNNYTGETLGSQCVIRVSNICNNEPMSQSVIKQVLMHEILHAIDTKSNLRIFDGQDGKCNEDKLDGLAEWLCMVLHDNPQLMDLLR